MPEVYYVVDKDGGAIMGPCHNLESATRTLATARALYPFETLMIKGPIWREEKPHNQPIFSREKLDRLRSFLHRLGIRL
jgi:hypothetical protein